MFMTGINQLIDTIEIVLRGKDSQLTVYVDVFDNSLSRKWLVALNDIIQNNYHLEKTIAFLDLPMVLVTVGISLIKLTAVSQQLMPHS